MGCTAGALRYGALPPRASSGESGACVARAAQCVPVPPQSRCAAGGTHMSRMALAIRQRRPGRAARSSHCEHDAPDIRPPRAETSEHELLEKKVFNGTLKRPDSKSGGAGTSQALRWYIISAARAISAHVRTRRHLDCGPSRVSACGPQRVGPAGIWIAGCTSRGSARVGEGQHWQFIAHAVTARESRPIQLPLFRQLQFTCMPKRPRSFLPHPPSPLGPMDRTGGSWSGRAG
jgi:hypothetical protein